MPGPIFLLNRLNHAYRPYRRILALILNLLLHKMPEIGIWNILCVLHIGVEISLKNTA